MGASTFSVYGEGEALDDAFHRAYDQCGWEDGHSYSGTLSSKSGARAIIHTPMARRAAERYAHELIDANDPRVDDKWGPAAAIPVCEDTAMRTRTVKVKASSAAEYPHDAAETLAAAITLAPGEQIISIDPAPLTPLRYRAAVKTTEGPAVMRYRVMLGHNPVGEMHATQAAARKALTEAMRAPGAGHIREGSILAVKVREDGAPLVVATREPVARQITGTVTIGTVKPGAKTVGWLMFGWAPS